MKKIIKIISLTFIISLILGGSSVQVFAQQENTDFRISQYIIESGEYIEGEPFPSVVELKRKGEEWIVQELNIAGFYKADGIDKVYPQSELKIVLDEESDEGVLNITEENGIQILKPGKAVVRFEAEEGVIVHTNTILREDVADNKDIDESINLPENLVEKSPLNIQPLAGEEPNFRIRQYTIENGGYVEGEPLPSEIIMEKDGDNWKQQIFTATGFYTVNGEDKVYPTPTLKIEEYEGKGEILDITRRKEILIKKPGKAVINFKVTRSSDGVPVGDNLVTIIAKEPVDSSKFSVELINLPENLQSGDDVNIVAKAAMPSVGNDSENALLIVGLYDRNNTMINYSYAEKEVLAGQSVKLGAGFKLPENSSGYKVKIFLWDNWANKNAISDVTEIDVK